MLCIAIRKGMDLSILWCRKELEMYRCLIGHQLPGFLREMDAARKADEFSCIFRLSYFILRVLFRPVAA